MSFPRRKEPFQALAEKVTAIRAEAIATLCSGRWETEAEARGLVGQIKAMNDIIDEMRTIAGPNTHFGEQDM